MILLIGPCMFFAPLVILLIPLAIVLWPPTMILLGVAWLVLWPFAAMGAGKVDAWAVRAHEKIERWLLTLLTPWTSFDTPKNIQTVNPEDEPPSA